MLQRIVASFLFIENLGGVTIHELCHTMSETVPETLK
jgi:hypothetical protein